MATIKDKKVVTEFMGCTVGIMGTYSLPEYGYLTLKGEFKTDFQLNELKYHTSWEW